MDNTFLLWTLVAILFVVGFAGLVLPAIPGAILIFGGALLGAWIDNFQFVGVGALVTIGVMAAFTFICDIAGTALGAKRFGASRRAIAGAAIGTVIGIFFGVVGILIGPFLGAVIGQLTHQGDLAAATRAGIGASIGLAIAAAGKIALGIAMIGVFLIVRFL